MCVPALLSGMCLICVGCVYVLSVCFLSICVCCFCSCVFCIMPFLSRFCLFVSRVFFIVCFIYRFCLSLLICVAQDLCHWHFVFLLGCLSIVVCVSLFCDSLLGFLSCYV